jgi:hypothetical protein
MKIRNLMMIAVAAVLAFAAANVNAQTAQLVMTGSSALYLQLGQAAYQAQGCVWTTSSSSGFAAEDTRSTGTEGLEANDEGAAWIVWNPGTGGTCASPAGTANVWMMIKLDSVIGDRCYFAKPRCTIQNTGGFAAGATGNSTLTGNGITITDTALPGTILSAITNQPVNAAATDIRPEDAKFAINRALTTCGTPIVAGSQYLGLGYQQSGTFTTGSPELGIGVGVVESTQANSKPQTYNVINFNLSGTDPISGDALPGTYQVVPMGAVPIVVFVTPTKPAGFGSLAVTNIDSAVLAGYLDGTYGRTSEIGGSASNTTTVFQREPLSGTYNTMEYAIPNSVQNQSSQDVGLAALDAYINAGDSSTYPFFNCTAVGGTVQASISASDTTGTGNPLEESDTRGGGSSFKYRAIGTGDEVAAVLAATSDALGYSFWGTGNFKSALASNAKYLTVNGIDPLSEVWSDGEIPTSANDLLSNVSFTHVKDGSYPIWSFLRVVTDASLAGSCSSTSTTPVCELQNDVAHFVSPNQPDFVLNSQVTMVRSHFAPPGVTTPLNGGAISNGSGATSESGGDVGGMVYTITSDTDYNTDFGITTGNTGHRQ